MYLPTRNHEPASLTVCLALVNSLISQFRHLFELVIAYASETNQSSEFEKNSLFFPIFLCFEDGVEEVKLLIFEFQ